MDGFFVAKFQKIGPTPANLVKDGPERPQPTADEQGAEEEVIDKTPIAADDQVIIGQENDGFGGFDDEEDEKYMEKAKRNAMRRRGLDPNALNKDKVKGKGKISAGEKTGSKATEKLVADEETVEKTNGKAAAKAGGKSNTNGKVKNKKKA